MLILDNVDVLNAEAITASDDRAGIVRLIKVFHHDGKMSRTPAKDFFKSRSSLLRDERQKQLAQFIA